MASAWTVRLARGQAVGRLWVRCGRLLGHVYVQGCGGRPSIGPARSRLGRLGSSSRGYSMGFRRCLPREGLRRVREVHAVLTALLERGAFSYGPNPEGTSSV